jgi:hypothetical protein
MAGHEQWKVGSTASVTYDHYIVIKSPYASKDPSAIACLVSDGAAQGGRGTLTGRRKESPVAGRQSTAGLAG